MPDDIAVSIFTRRAPSDGAQTINREARTVEAVLSTGAIVRRRDWDGEFDEELLVTDQAVNLSMLKDAPVLLDHRVFDSGSIVGRVERAWLANGQIVGLLRFSGEEPGASSLKKVGDGTFRTLSLGYSIEAVEEIKRPNDVPLRRATRWTPREVSLVTLAADPGAKLRSLSAQGAFKMDPQQTPGVAPAIVEQPPAADPGTIERQRSVAILERVEVAGLPTTFALDLIKRNVHLDRVGDAIVDEMAKNGSQRVFRPRIEGGADFTDPILRRDLMAEALAARSSPHVKVSAPARQFMHYRLEDVAREILAMRGEATVRERVGHLPIGELFARVLTTSDFPLLLADVGSKTLLAAYMAAPAGILSIGRRRTAPDFKTKHQIRLGEAPTPEKVNQAGEFKYGSMAEADETYKVEEYGKILKLSRPVLVNDDLSAFSDLTNRFAIAARELEAQVIVDLLTTASGVGPTMSDGQPLFHSTHGNLAGAGAAIDVTTVGAGRTAMRSQKGLSGRPVNIVPKFLVVNAAKETLGEQVLSTIYAAKVSDANPFSERLSLVVDPRLDAKSTTAWYLAADQAQAALEYAHLEGEEGPKVELKEGWNTSGVEVRCYMTFGAGAVDHRGIYRNPGA